MFGRIGIWELLLILAIVILIFGTKKMRNLGGDLGAALRNFKSAVKEGDQDSERKQEDGNKLPESGQGAEPKKPDGQ
jgi:sec-independent protein translocase protein TatA